MEEESGGEMRREVGDSTRTGVKSGSLCMSGEVQEQRLGNWSCMSRVRCRLGVGGCGVAEMVFGWFRWRVCV